MRKMQQVNISEAKARLSHLIKKALDGEDVIIAKNHEPLVKLMPVRWAAQRRYPGSAKGRVKVARDFGAPLVDLQEYR